nr:hypothetical protein [uncultured Agathobacter sp.]
MKEIMQTYGSMIVAALVGIILLSSFSMVKGNIGEAFAVQEVLADDMTNSSYDKYKNVALPKLSLRDDFFNSSTSYKISDILYPASNAQNLADMQAFEVFDKEGEVSNACMSEDGRVLNFPESGIYTLYVKVTCTNKMTDYLKVSIPVN